MTNNAMGTIRSTLSTLVYVLLLLNTTCTNLSPVHLDDVEIHVNSNNKNVIAAIVYYTDDPGGIIELQRTADGASRARIRDLGNPPESEVTAPKTAITDNNGRCFLQRQSARSIKAFIVDKSGYSVVSVQPFETHKDLVLEHWASVNVKLTTSVSEKPVSDRIVTMRQLLPATPGQQMVKIQGYAKAESDGWVRFAQVASGRIQLAEAPAFTTFSNYERVWTEFCDAKAGEYVNVLAPNGNASLVGSISPGIDAIVSLVSVDSVQTPNDRMEGAQLHYYRRSTESVRRYCVQVNKDGSFEFNNVAFGEYLLSIHRHLSSRPDVVEVALISVTLRSAEPKKNLGLLQDLKWRPS